VLLPVADGFCPCCWRDLQYFHGCVDSVVYLAPWHPRGREPQDERVVESIELRLQGLRRCLVAVSVPAPAASISAPQST
jgi:hypothetical protein